MSGGGGGSFNQSKSSGNQQGRTAVDFPWSFLTDAARVYGPGFDVNNIIRMMPSSQGLFGGQVGFQGGQGGQPQQQQGQGARQLGQGGLGFGGGGAQQGQQPWNPQEPYFSSSLPQQQGQTYASNPERAPSPQEWSSAPPYQYSLADVSDIMNRVAPRIGKADQKAFGKFAGALQKNLGESPTGTFSLADIEIALKKSDLKNVGAYIPQIMGEFARREQLGQAMGQAAQRPGVQGAQVGLQGIPESVERLGFGRPDQMANVGRAVGMIQPTGIAAGQGQGAQSDIAGGDYNRYEQSIYESMFNPVRREMERQGGIADRQLEARLAQSGLQSSGTGIGQLLQQRRERGERLISASEEAASRATAQRFGAQFEEQMANARLRQEAEFQNLGLNLEGQVANAANALQAGVERSGAYLRAIGLNTETASRARNDFLQLLGAQSEDLMRQDRFAMETFATMFDSYLKQIGAAVQAGGGSTSEGKERSSSFGISGYGGGGVGGGG